MQLTIPAHPNLVSLGQYSAYMNSGSGVGKVAAITGITEEEAEKLKPQTIHEICSAFDSILDLAVPILPAIIEIRSKKSRFRFLDEKIRFGFMPDLNDASVKEFADLITLEEQPIKNCLKMAAIMFRPITDTLGKWYAIEDYNSNRIEKYLDYTKQIPLPIYLGARAFFLTTHNECLMQIPEFSQRIARNIESEIVKERKRMLLKQRKEQLTARLLGMVGITTS
jgi:hypothetical protein